MVDWQFSEILTVEDASRYWGYEMRQTPIVFQKLACRRLSGGLKIGQVLELNSIRAVVYQGPGDEVGSVDGGLFGIVVHFSEENDNLAVKASY